MTRDEIFAMLKHTFVETFELEEHAVVLEADLREDLELDSIDAVDMAVHLQEFTGRKLELAELKEVRTVSDVVDLVQAQLSES